jgi:hypothetical protein
VSIGTIHNTWNSLRLEFKELGNPGYLEYEVSKNGQIQNDSCIPKCFCHFRNPIPSKGCEGTSDVFLIPTVTVEFK